MQRNISISILLLHICAFSSSFAQHYSFQTYTELDGLPSSCVHAVNQDSLGQMWFATRSGLVAYDGLKWDIHGSGQGLPDRVFAHLDIDSLGRMWTISMRSPVQVAYRDNDDWVLLPFLELEFSGWTILDFKVSKQPGELLFVAAVSGGGFVSVWDGNNWRQVGSGSVFNKVYSVEFMGSRLLVASENGLFAVDLITWELDDAPLSDLPVGPILAIALNRTDSSICIVGEQWIGMHHQGRFEMLADDLDIFLPEKHNGVRVLLDQVGGIYIGGRHRLYFFSPSTGKLEPMTQASGLTSEGVTCLFLDREGITWFSSTRGISKLISRRFAHFDSQSGLFKDEVSAIEVRKSGRVVLGHEGGLTFLGPEITVSDLGKTYNLLGRVIDLEEDPQGLLWLAADRLGLASMDDFGNLVWYRAEQGLAGSIYAIHFDHKGQLLVGANDGLFGLKGDHFEQVFLPLIDQEESPFVRRIESGRNGSALVVAGFQGVFRLYLDQVHHWPWDNSPEQSLYTAYEKIDGSLWVGSSHGLYKSENGKLVKSAYPGPVINRPIYSIVDGPADQLWFGTDSGVMIWDGLTLQHFTPREGLLGGETNRDALQMDHQGRMLIGTDRGFSVFSQEYNLSPGSDPIVELVGFEVEGQAFSPSEKLVIDTPPHSLTAYFRGISFRSHHDWGVNTWLENFETTWQKPGQWTQRAIQYTNLPPGKYRLHLRTERIDGYIGSVVTSSEILIGKPFWLRWWFVLLEIASGILVFRIALSIFSSKKYSRELEQEIQTQTRELRESEKLVRAESQRFSATLDSVSEGVMTLDAQDRIVLCNPVAESILGTSTTSLLGKNIFDVIPQLKMVRTKPSGQHKFENPERGNIWLETTSAPITSSDGQQVGQVLALRDITERRAHNKELLKAQKLESLGLLAGGIAHDFNNLLTIIYGNIELIQSTPGLPDNGVVRMERAKLATKRATSLTEQLLTFARGGAPKRQVSSMAELVEQASSLTFSGKTQSCEIMMEIGLWPVFVDPGQMHQVLSNIFINACQAMDEGGTVYVSGRNTVSVPEDLPPGRYVHIDIKDQGTGIPKRNLTKIFDPYFTTKEQGSGLGLATTYSIISRHSGFLKVESEEGKGATFNIYLPFCSDDPTPQKVKPTLQIAAGQRILVMDDEADVCLIIASLLAEMGLEAEITSHGEEAIATYISSQKSGKEFAAVLLDLTVPGAMGGKEALSQLLKINPQLKSIVISGYSKDPVMANFSDYGFSAALSKPFSFQELEAVLAQVVG